LENVFKKSINTELIIILSVGLIFVNIVIFVHDTNSLSLRVCIVLYVYFTTLKPRF
jgi:hypothetical protein